MVGRLYRTEAGYAGEIKVDRYLESIEFTERVHIFTDLQLSINPKFDIQIDTLILTPSYAFILEIKNIAGTLNYISNPPHFECTYEDKKSIVIDCPIMQLNNNRNGLDIWLERNGFPIKSTGMIVMANNKTSVKNAPPEMPIMYAKHLPLYFRTREVGQVLLADNQFYSLVEKLSRGQQQYNPYPLCERYRIDKTHISKGIICNTCNNKVNRVNHMVWICPACELESNQPFAEGLKDWFMIMKNTISNEECRNFFQLKDKYAANYVLKSLPLKRVGKSRASIYTWDYKVSPSTIQKRKKPTSKD
ncbi:nuclease-related domain-containing protein [Sporosarcina sp. E16_8]|uniref:NERD domain-containing protein n=1 Tax=Sporosarcina sp. E16_8 TaxID=2789295 RepID=UPI001A90D637|nr:NERD domain-containing protein [Sporosarcina sp. E16_8]